MTKRPQFVLEVYEDMEKDFFCIGITAVNGEDTFLLGCLTGEIAGGHARLKMVSDIPSQPASLTIFGSVKSDRG